MDVLDRHIIIEPQSDGRQTNAHLAETLGVGLQAFAAEYSAHSRDFIVELRARHPLRAGRPR